MDRFNFIVFVFLLILAFLYLRIFNVFEQTWKEDLLHILWMAGMFLFNFGVIHVYRSFKGNYWNWSLAKAEPDFKFRAISIIVVVVLFLIIMPSERIIYWLAESGVILIILFFYDLIVNGKH